jgi:hypothetical protein
MHLTMTKRVLQIRNKIFGYVYHCWERRWERPNFRVGLEFRHRLPLPEPTCPANSIGTRRVWTFNANGK